MADLQCLRTLCQSESLQETNDSLKLSNWIAFTEGTVCYGCKTFQGFKEYSKGPGSHLGLPASGACHHPSAWKDKLWGQVLERELIGVGMSHCQPLVEENHHSNLAGKEQETKPLGLAFSHLHLLLRLLLAYGNQKPRHKGALIAVLKSVSWTQITCRRVVRHPLEPADDICPTCEEAQHVNSMAQNCMGDIV